MNMDQRLIAYTLQFSQQQKDLLVSTYPKICPYLWDPGKEKNRMLRCLYQMISTLEKPQYHNNIIIKDECLNIWMDMQLDFHKNKAEN